MELSIQTPKQKLQESPQNSSSNKKLQVESTFSSDDFNAESTMIEIQDLTSKVENILSANLSVQ